LLLPLLHRHKAAAVVACCSDHSAGAMSGRSPHVSTCFGDPIVGFIAIAGVYYAVFVAARLVMVMVAARLVMVVLRLRSYPR